MAGRTLAALAVLAGGVAASGAAQQPACRAHPHRVSELAYWDAREGALPCMYAGPVSVAADQHLFYMMYRMEGPAAAAAAKLNEAGPVLIWLQGGPGASSAEGNFIFSGPLRISRTGPGVDDFAVRRVRGHNAEGQPQSWNEFANVVYLDQPVGTGFGYGRPARSLNESAGHFVAFLVKLLESFPELRSSPLFITGESYAGKYVPLYTAAVLDHNDALPRDSPARINLQASAVGDPFAAPARQRVTMHELARVLTILDAQHVPQVAALERRCVESLVNVTAAAGVCSAIIEFVVAVSGGAHEYDLREFAADWAPIAAPVPDYFTVSGQAALIQRQLHMDNSTKRPAFEMDSSAVYEALVDDNIVDYTKVYEALVGRIPLVVYAGEFDAKDGPWSVEAWAREMVFPGSAEFWAQSRELYWLPDGRMGGYFRAQRHTGLHFVSVPKAGHFVPANNFPFTVAMLTDLIDERRLRCHDKTPNACSVVQARCQAMDSCSGHGKCDARGECQCQRGWRGADCSLALLALLPGAPLTVSSRGPKWFALALEAPARGARITVTSQLPFDAYISRDSSATPTQLESDLRFSAVRSRLVLDSRDLGLDAFSLALFVRGADYRNNELLHNSLMLELELPAERERDELLTAA